MDISRQTSFVVRALARSVAAARGRAAILGVLLVLSLGFAPDGTPQTIGRESGLRMFVLGQALIRHELGFESPQSLEQARQFLAGADATFTDLEAPVQTRDGMPFSHIGLVLELYCFGLGCAAGRSPSGCRGVW